VVTSCSFLTRTIRFTDPYRVGLAVKINITVYSKFKTLQF